MDISFLGGKTEVRKVRFNFHNSFTCLYTHASKRMHHRILQAMIAFLHSEKRLADLLFWVCDYKDIETYLDGLKISFFAAYFLHSQQ